MHTLRGTTPPGDIGVVGLARARVLWSLVELQLIRPAGRISICLTDAPT